MQSYLDIPESESLTNSRLKLLNNILTTMSCSSGTVFPTTNLQVGMMCLRTDEMKLYQLKDATPTWKLIFNLNKTATDKEYVDASLSNYSSTLTGAVTTILSANLATSRALVSDGSGKVAASAITAAELGNLAAVTGNVQTQLNSKFPNSALPAGTKMLFAQTAAPVGWTKDVVHDNKALRVVSGTAGSGGSAAFTSVFASRAVSGSIGSTTVTGWANGTTLSTAQIPSHTHAHALGYLDWDGGYTGAAGGSREYPDMTETSSAVGGGGAHSHSIGTNAHGHTFAGTAIDMAVQYVDIIIATKN